ncbi:hypothetical protein M9X92_011658 [Pyricularia oryzae]|nr:hypothetical protein M9X92_011658 [Pyricularia oryzae]
MSLHESRSAGRNIPGSIMGGYLLIADTSSHRFSNFLIEALVQNTTCISTAVNPGLDVMREAIEDSTIHFWNQYVSLAVLLELACPMFLGDGLMPSWEKNSA